MKLVTAFRLMTDRQLRGQFLLSQSKNCFRSEWDRGWADLSDPVAASDIDHFAALRADGIVIIPNYVSGADLGALQNEVNGAGFAHGSYAGSAKFANFQRDGICALEISDATPISKKLIAGNKHIDSIAKSLFGPDTNLTTAALLSKYGADRVDSSNVPHWDDWFPRFKAFLYVFDVGAADAPMLYAKGSHRREIPSWRFDKDFGGKYMPNATAGGSWVPFYGDDFHFVSCAAPAGSLVLFDARGVHSGTQLVRGPRVMLMGMWTRHMKYQFRPY